MSPRKAVAKDRKHMMNLKTLLTAAVLLLTVPPTMAQTRRPAVTVSGHITDKATGETLIEAAVLSGEAGAVTNSYGFYTLTLPKGEGVTLRYSYVGYRDTTVTLDLVRDTTVNVALAADFRLNEAVVSAQRESGITATRMSAIEIPMNLIRNTPTLFGESDVLKTIQLMPGVQGGAEGFSGIYVRGGGPDENLLLLDGVSLYNAEHMLGLFSIFQPEAVKKVTLYKGSFPARYGGRISSIIDVRTNDGNLQETHGTVGVGLLSDKFHLEGPVFKGKTAYSISARGMHTFLFDGLLRACKVPANYFFYDLNAKISHRFSDSDRLFLNVYHGRDVFYYKDKEDENISYGSSSSWDDKTKINWGNTVAALRWNHVFNGRLFSNTTLAWTGYDMNMGYRTKSRDTYDGKKTTYSYKFDYGSGIRDLTAKIDFDCTPSSRHLVKFGGEYVHHVFVPETATTVEKEETGGKTVTDTTYTNGKNPDRKGHEFSLYAEDDFSVWKWLTLNPGLHLSMFVTSGRTYWSPEPRVSAKADLGKGVSVKAAYSRMSQYVHLLSSARITLPLDLWVPITKYIKPVTADQYSLGLYYSGLQGWEFSVEGYWKDMHNVLEYKDGVSFLAGSKSWEDNVVMGEGRAFGVEFFIQKTMGKMTGWLGYTLAKSDRIFTDGLINNGERYPYRYDRRHNVSLVVNRKLGDKWDVSAVWTFATGGTTTVPEREVALQQPDGTFIQVDYSPHRNNYRLPPSHRLNIGVNYHVKKRRGESVWNFGLYNTYNKMNPNFVFYRANSESDPGTGLYARREKLKSLTILPIIPSFGYTYSF